ncbi:PD-(D/E)XK nuclease family protein [Desulfurobacterium thermolithotrophum]|uniref:PD-(D/E)XK nuclease family protein n=1 Tax=Desulfurobacterium thermolithotrophum TaxID=64160 RepID=UPI0013D5BBB1
MKDPKIKKLLDGLSEFIRERESPLTHKEKRIKNRYTITGDIISYSICPRQYGFYKILGYAPSNPTQEWYGNIIHRFLKRAHLFYLRENRVVNDEETEKIFNLIEKSMEAEGVRATNPKVRESALKVLKKFCSVEGEQFFKSIVEAELRLIKELDNFILYGIIDVLRTEGEKVEIWDYKGMERPDETNLYGREKLNRYKKQMYVYGFLFKERTGTFPDKAVLYFMNELLKENLEKTKFIIDFQKEEIQNEVEDFIEEFKRIVEEIEESQKTNNWRLPENIDKNTCKQCDFRWDCPKFLSFKEEQVI